MFGAFPLEVVEFVRATFAAANSKVSRALTLHPSLHEETLDHMLLAELSASPPVFFANSNSAVRIETHWLGGRRMFGRWEIADIAIFIMLRSNGGLISRKVALLQTKRLYSKKLSGDELDIDDFYIGVGRLADRVEPTFPLTRLRTYSFDERCIFKQIEKGSDQIARIDEYQRDKDIPVYYGLYCPLIVPIKLHYPSTNGSGVPLVNMLGVRVQRSALVHDVVASLKKRSPTLLDLSMPKGADKPTTDVGFRLEDFVADQILACREGRLFEEASDPNLRGLLYERSAPISAAISLTIDFGIPG